MREAEASQEESRVGNLEAAQKEQFEVCKTPLR